MLDDSKRLIRYKTCVKLTPLSTATQQRFTHWPLGDLNAILKMQSSVLLYWLVSSIFWCIRWIPQDLTCEVNKSILVWVMAWCRQATTHYLNQCWTRFLAPYGVTRLQWVKLWTHHASAHWGRDKMSANFRTRLSSAFSWMKIYEFLIVQLSIFQHWFT